MSFREKSAWISFVCLLLLALAYFAGMHHHPHDAEGRDLINPLHLALAIFGAFVLLQLVLHLIITVQAPKDAHTPKDERELLIELRAARVGFYALVVGEFLSLAGVHVHGSWGALMSSVLYAILIAWLIKLGTEIVQYRRGR